MISRVFSMISPLIEFITRRRSCHSHRPASRSCAKQNGSAQGLGSLNYKGSRCVLCHNARHAIDGSLLEAGERVEMDGEREQANEQPTGMAHMGGSAGPGIGCGMMGGPRRSSAAFSMRSPRWAMCTMRARGWGCFNNSATGCAGSIRRWALPECGAQARCCYYAPFDLHDSRTRKGRRSFRGDALSCTGRMLSRSERQPGGGCASRHRSR